MIGADVDTTPCWPRCGAARQRVPQRGPAPGRGRGAAACAAQPRSRTCATRGSRSSARPSSWCSSTRWSIGRTTADVGAGRLHAPDLPRGVGRWSRPPADGGRGRRPQLVGRSARRASRPCRAPRGQRARRRAAANRRSPTVAYVAQHVVGLLELTALRRIADLKSKLQRTNPVEHAETFNRMFGELAALEEHRRKLRDRIVGAAVKLRRTGPAGRGRGGGEGAGLGRGRVRRRRRHPGGAVPPWRRPDPVGAGRGRRLGPRLRDAQGQRGRHLGRAAAVVLTSC